MSVRSNATLVSSYIGNEIPVGDINKVNLDFELANTPIELSVVVRLSGIVQVPGVGKDYTILGKIITFFKAPRVGQEVAVSYFAT